MRVRNNRGVDRDVQLRAITYEKARSLLYEQWIQDTEQKVAAVSGNKLGYLHIHLMDMPSFYQFERDLYNVGIHKEGLIVDVRENGGGSTTDHLLTALTQPVHAITVPRGGQPGYPQDRKVYATWNKPIVVLCNQNSFSDAEIFVHAIKTLHRGPVVGVPTAGGVLGTNYVQIMDVGRLRVPYRGWFLLDNGEDMELNGAMPDYVVWPRPATCLGGRTNNSPRRSRYSRPKSKNGPIVRTQYCAGLASANGHDEAEVARGAKPYRVVTTTLGISIVRHKRPKALRFPAQAAPLLPARAAESGRGFAS